ncbi:MAG: hypothetical protein U1E03_08515 [Hyphomonadaceae bacterium]
MTSLEDDEDWPLEVDGGESVDPSKLRGFLGFIYDGAADVFPNDVVPLAKVYFEHLVRSGCKAKSFPAAAEAEEMQRFRKALCDGLLPVLLFTGSKAAGAVRREVWADEERFRRALQGWHMVDDSSMRAIYVCERTSVDQWLGQPLWSSDERSNSQISPYLRVMLNVAAKLSITRTNAGKKGVVEAEIENEWAARFPKEKPLSESLRSKMGTLVRWPGSSLGKGDPHNIARKKEPPS